VRATSDGRPVVSVATPALRDSTTTATGLLRVATAGSVDDGKSTLVGRLLYDTKTVLADTLASVTQTSLDRGGDAIDLSLLTDGLRAEREQGITIDVAYRYLTTPRRSIVLIDTPGHVQYTRNTVTGASNADVALLLVDVRTGLVEQARRHLAVLALLRVAHLVLAVNKVDLVGFDEAAFRSVGADVASYAAGLGVHAVTAVPVSALRGDNVTTRSDAMPWYDGPTLLGLLETLEVDVRPGAALRFPVQWVARPPAGAADEGRRYAGTVTAGVLRPGDEVLVLPAGGRTTVTAVDTPAGPLAAAGRGAAVTVRLADDLDVGRGDTLVDPASAPAVIRELDLDVAWMSTRTLRAGDRVRVRHTGRVVRGLVTTVLDTLDVAAGVRVPADTLGANDIGRVRLTTAEPLAVDAYADDRATGGLLLLDEASGDTLGAGLVRARCLDG